MINLAILSNNTQKIVLIIAIVVLGLAFLTFLVLFLIKLYNRYCYHKVMASKVYKCALYNDYYLINDFKIKVSEDETFTIPHVMFGNKYIYLIFHQYYKGPITGKEDDQSIIRYGSDSSKNYEENPLLIAKSYANKFSINTEIPLDYLVCVTITNNDTSIAVEQNDKYNYLIKTKSLPLLVKEVEKRDVADIKKDELKNIVLDLYNNLHKKED